MEYIVNNMQALIDALAQSDCTKIKFSDNISADSPLNISKDVEIDLSGYALQIDTLEGLTISGGQSTIKNGRIISNEDDPIAVAGLMTALTLGPALTITTQECALYVKQRGKVVIDGAEIKSNGDDAAVFIEGYGVAKNNSYLEMRSGTISSYNQTAVSVAKRGKFTLIDGRVECKIDDFNVSKSASVYGTGGGTIIEILGGEIYSPGVAALGGAENATILITGGRLSTDSEHEPVIKLSGTGITYVQSGGVVASHATSGIHIHMIEDAKIDIKIHGGEISVPVSKLCIDSNVDLADSIVIDGGKFHGGLDTSYISPDCKYIIDEDGYLVIIVPDDEPDDNESNDTPEEESGTDNEPDTELEPEPEIKEVAYGGVIARPTYVYGTPCKSFLVTQIVGAVKVVSEGHKDSLGNTYSCIKYKLPGNGKQCIGYVLSSAIKTGGAM